MINTRDVLSTRVTVGNKKFRTFQCIPPLWGTNGCFYNQNPPYLHPISFISTSPRNNYSQTNCKLARSWQENIWQPFTIAQTVQDLHACDTHKSVALPDISTKTVHSYLRSRQTIISTCRAINFQPCPKLSTEQLAEPLYCVNKWEGLSRAVGLVAMATGLWGALLP